MKIVIWESFRGVFYTPYYAAFALKAFEAEGLDVSLGTVPDLADVGDAIRDGQAHVAWGGPMRVMVDHDRHPDSDITCFCEVVARDPFFLIGREPNPDFKMSDLLDVAVGTVSEVPTPWMCLQEDMRGAGHDPDRLTRVIDRTMAENADALRGGGIDVVQLFEPYVEMLISEGSGHIWYAAASRGRTSYTTFYARRTFLDEHPDIAQKLTRAIYRTQKWIAANGAGPLARTVAPYFPDIDPIILEGSIARCIEHGIWGGDPVMSRESFERQCDGLVSGGLIGRRIAYDACVDMQFAEAAVAADPPVQATP